MKARAIEAERWKPFLMEDLNSTLGSLLLGLQQRASAAFIHHTSMRMGLSFFAISLALPACIPAAYTHIMHQFAEDSYPLLTCYPPLLSDAHTSSIFTSSIHQSLQHHFFPQMFFLSSIYISATQHIRKSRESITSGEGHTSRTHKRIPSIAHLSPQIDKSG